MIEHLREGAWGGLLRKRISSSSGFITGPERTLFIVVSLLFILVIGGIGAYSLTPGTRKASANCNSCHSSSYYQTVEVKSVGAPTQIDKGDTVDVTALVEVAASHSSSSWTGFKITASIASLNGKTSVPSSQVLNNQVVAGSSAPYTWSNTFTFSVKGTAGGAETLRVTASMDPYHYSPAVSDSNTDTTEVIISNYPPELTGASVTPSSGDTNTMFSYQVTYSDPEGDAPEYITLTVDGIDPHPMILEDGVADSYETGEVFTVTGILLEDGVHTYHILTSDGAESARLPGSGRLTGPDVAIANRAPVLWDGKVTPTGGSPTVDYRFSVIYTDEDNDPPVGGVVMFLDDDPTSTAMELDLDAPSYHQDGNFANGERYRTIMKVDVGDHSFRFNATDGNFFSDTGPIHGPVVSNEPLLIAELSLPLEGASFYADEAVWLSGGYRSNIEMSDVVFEWSSTLSGSLGWGPDLNVTLEEGSHLISVEASSVEHSLSDTESINITVLTALAPYEINGSYPVDDPTIDELEEAVFSIDIFYREEAELGVRWMVDSMERASGVEGFTYITSYNDTGTHEVTVIVYDGGLQVHERSWLVEVLNTPAPIIETGEVQSDLGEYFLNDTISITMPLADLLDRDLTTEWYIDGVGKGHTGLTWDLLLDLGNKADVGVHSITLIVENKDGFELTYTLTYTVKKRPVIPDGDDEIPDEVPGDEGGDEGLDLGLGPLSTEWPGYLIMMGGIIGTIFGMAYGAFVLIRKDERSAPPVPVKGLFNGRRGPRDDGNDRGGKGNMTSPEPDREGEVVRAGSLGIDPQVSDLDEEIASWDAEGTN